MFVSDQLVFLHLQKAAGSYIVESLAQTLPGKVCDGHAPLTAELRGRVVASAIRDPWDWYVSLWAYGCLKQGELRGHLTQSRRTFLLRTLRSTAAARIRPADAWTLLSLNWDRDPKKYLDLYASVDEPSLFRRWLCQILNPPGCGHLPDIYPVLPMSGGVGFMTYRVLRLFCAWDVWKTGMRGIRTPEDALEFYQEHGIVDHVLRTENLDNDLERLLAALSVTRLDKGQATGNKSSRHSRDFYYDEETVALVMEKDRMVVEAFGYAPPEHTA